MSPSLDSIAGAPLIVLAPAVGGVAFVVAGSFLRRSHGSWALLTITLFTTTLAVAILTRRHVLDVVFLAPVVPGLVVAGGVLEWRARRAARTALWSHVVWGTAVFFLTVLGGLAFLLAGFKCTGCVG